MGMTTFAAAGNNGSKSGVSFPACINDVVSVGAVYDDDVGFRLRDVIDDTLKCESYVGFTLVDTVRCLSVVLAKAEV